MCNAKLRCSDCEEEYGKAYIPRFESITLNCYSVDEEGEFIENNGIVAIESYYCAQCYQVLELD